MFRKLLAVLFALFLVLLGVLVGRTLLLKSATGSRVAFEAIALDETVLPARLSQAISFETINAGGEVPVAHDALMGLHQYLIESFPLVHQHLERLVVREYSLLYHWPGKNPEADPIVLMAHMDVVPIPPESLTNWEHAPFSGDVADGFIWGRGSLDDKASLMAALESVEYLIAQGFEPERPVWLAFGHDEEAGGTGARALADHLASLDVRPWLVLDEGSYTVQGVLPGIEAPVAVIGLAEKGYLTVKLKVEGEGGHSSTPPAKTPIGRLSRAIARLEAQQMPARLQPPVSDMFDAVAPEMPFTLRLVMANRWLLEGLLLGQLTHGRTTNALVRTTTAPTLFHAGIKDNVLPLEATATVNFRLLPDTSLDDVMAHIREVIDDDAIVVEVGDGVKLASPVTDPSGPAYALVKRTIEGLYPDVVTAPGLVIGGTDSRHFNEISQATIRYLPIHLTAEDIPRYHGTNERIGVKDYLDLVRFYIHLVQAAK